jgi:hypothetical protein
MDPVPWRIVVMLTVVALAGGCGVMAWVALFRS